MSQTYAWQPPPVPPVHSPENGLGTAGFVIGLVGLLFSPIPLIGVVAWPLVILGLVFSLVGSNRARRGRATNGGLAIAGIVLSSLGLLICILWAAVFSKAVNDVVEESRRAAVIQYEVGGDARDVTVHYTTYGNGVSSNQETVATLPWTKQVETTGTFKGGSLIITAGPDGGTVTCKVIVDGKEAKTATASGPFSTASCSDF